MANAETARLIASLELQDKFTPGVNKAVGSLGKLDAGISRSSTRAYRAGQQIGTGIKTGAVIAAGAIGFLATQAAAGVNQLAQLEDATAATNAAIKSTKGVAGQTAASIRNLAEKYEVLNATIDDKVIQSGENVLLTFTNIRKKAFEPALKAALDLSVGMKQDLQTSIVQIGKALNDPIKGLTSLSRIGVAFTQQQKDQIKQLVKNNDLFGAQKIILGELNKEFGGRFAAAGNTAKGTLAGIGDAVEDLQKAFATGLFPIVQKVLPKIRAALADPAVIAQVQKFGESIAGLFSDKNLAAGADFLKGAFETAKAAAPVVAAAARTTFGFVKAAVGLFQALPKELQGLLVGGFALNKLTGGLVTNIGGGIAEQIAKSIVGNRLERGGSPLNPLFVSDVGKGAGDLVGDALKGGGVAATIKAGLTTVSKLSIGLGVAIAGIDALGELIKATSTPGQLAFNEQNAIEENRRKRQLPGVGPDTATAAAISAGLLGLQKTINPVLNALKLGQTNAGARGDDVAVRRGVEAGTAGLKTAFVKAIDTLKTSQDPEKIAAAVKTAMEAVSKGKGNADTTRTVLRGLQAALKNTHDPKLEASLRAQIAKVEHRLPGRELAAHSLSSLNRILSDGKVTNRELRTVQQIERNLKDHGLPHAASVIRAKIAEAQRGITVAESNVANAVRRKRLAVTVNNAITVPVSISSYEIRRAYRREHSAYTTLPDGGA